MSVIYNSPGITYNSASINYNGFRISGSTRQPSEEKRDIRLGIILRCLVLLFG
jgi:hypothetical protein